MTNTIRTYGNLPYHIALLHGGPGAAGEMKPVAEALQHDFGVLECLQTATSVDRQLTELHNQLTATASFPVILTGYSWGAWLALLFAARYPALVSKVILISSGAFESKYNNNLMKIRLTKLSNKDRKEAEEIIAEMESGKTDNSTLQRFGELMTIADSYAYLPAENESVEPDMEVYQSVWAEAVRMRETNELIHRVATVQCPVVAFHGDADPHPAEGVEIPLSEHLKNFRMIQLEKCGHTPWKEKYAKDNFFRLLKKELNTQSQ